MLAITEITVPAWPASEGRVGFTCFFCDENQQVLVEGCQPGAVADVGCDGCGAVNTIQVRKAMFS